MGKDASGTVYSSSAFWGRMLQSFPASYTVWYDSDDSLYWAERNLKGGTDYSNADAATVWQAAIDALPPEGGIIHPKGVHTILSSLTIDRDHVTIMGEGRQGTLIDFSSAPAGSLFTLGNGSTRREMIELSNMSLKGRNSGSYPQTAINVDYCRRLRFTNLEIYYFAGTNMYALEGRMADALVFDCHMWSNANNMMVNGASSNTANKIISNYFFLSAASTGYHIDIQAGSGHNRIIGNLFEGSVNRVKINASNNVFSGNTFEWINNVDVVDLDVDDDQCTIKNNYFTNHVQLIAGNEVDGTLRSAIPIDLSGAASTQYFHFPGLSYITNAYLIYTEASSADAGIALKIGKETDDDYFYSGTSETSQSQYYTATLTLLKHTITKGDTVVFTSAGGKVGTGEVMLVLEYVAGGWSSI